MKNYLLIAVFALCGVSIAADEPCDVPADDANKSMVVMSSEDAEKLLYVLERVMAECFCEGSEEDADAKAALSCCGPLEEIAACVSLIKEEVIELQSQLDSCCDQLNSKLDILLSQTCCNICV